MIKNLIVIFLFLVATSSIAANWQQVTVPGAYCGDGKPYSVFIQDKKSDKLLIEFMGGGVCWDFKSCFKKTSLFPWLHTYPVISSYSVMTSLSSTINPFKEQSKLYFPYCTGDVHMGNHIGNYNNKKVFHVGGKNIELTFNYLIEKNLINFKSYNDLVVYGASAGGIASLVYGKKIENLFKSNIKKTLIADSPGLHFGKTFWNKFDDKMKSDFKYSFNNVSLDVDFTDGFVAKKMRPVLDLYNDWEVVFIYALKDYVMSKSFGDISPEDEKKLLLSQDGIPSIAKEYNNVHVWYKDTYMHTFLLSKPSALMVNEENETAIDFVDKIYHLKH
jgi:hypothetical protein